MITPISVYAPPSGNERNQTPQQRKRNNRLALLLFMVTATIGLAIKYLS